MIAYLYLPKNASPPFQTLIFFPGAGALGKKVHENAGIHKWFMDYIIKSGRAVMYPVYKGTYERKDGMTRYA